jgi:hypothetical protein
VSFVDTRQVSNMVPSVQRGSKTSNLSVGIIVDYEYIILAFLRTKVFCNFPVTKIFAIFLSNNLILQCNIWPDKQIH